MKPDWNDAPDWANYVAMDADGSWWWFEERPFTEGFMWAAGGGQSDIAVPAPQNWVLSLRGRP